MLPVVGKVTAIVACAPADVVEVAAVPETLTALPKGAPLFRSCIVPVGAMPLLVVVTVATTEICVPAAADDGTPLMVVVVCAWVIVIGRLAETLPV